MMMPKQDRKEPSKAHEEAYAKPSTHTLPQNTTLESRTLIYKSQA